MNPKVSVIVPIYNAEQYLHRCLESILSQSLTELEVILVDDGSTDSSLSICRRYAETDSRIRVIAKKNGGAGSARNAGIEVARGEYLAFPDADDWFDVDMYHELYNIAKTGVGYDMVVSGVKFYERTSEGGLKYKLSELPAAIDFRTQAECRDHVMQLFPTTTIFDVPWNKLYRRELIIDNSIRFRDLRRCQDAMFNLDFYNHVQTVRTVDKAYYGYMLNTENDVQRKFPPEYFDIQMRYFKRLRELMTRWGIYSGWVREHYDTSMVMAVDTCARMYDNPRWGFSRRQRRDYIRHCLTCPEVREYLPQAHVRPDQRATARRILRGDVAAVMRARRRQRLIDRLRRLPLVAVPYRALRRLLKRIGG